MTRFINFDDPYNRWTLDKILYICNKVKEYATKHNLENVVLETIEDNRWSDSKNQRYDITISYYKGDHIWEQKLLLLKGELIDGKECHRRFNEFYS